MDAKEYKLNFAELVSFIQHVHVELSAQAGRAVNLSLTLRNWLIGFYIADYEQKGTDRAEYGVRLLESLSSRLGKTGLNGVAPRSLRQYRQFYLIYPGIWQTPSAKSWTTGLSFRNTSLNCPKKRKCSDLLKKKFEKRWISTNREMNFHE